MAETPVRIAIVDDDPSVRRALARLLRTQGYDAAAHASGAALLAALPHAMPACLILDQQMPGMTGLELHARLVGCGFRVPTLIITAHEAADHRRRAEAAGVAAYLTKPLDRHVVFAAIERALAAG